MLLSEIFETLERIGSTQSRTEKEAYLAAGGEDETFRRVLRAAYDPFKTYGILPTENRGGTGDQDDAGSMFGILEMLAARELTGNDAASAVEDVLELASPSAGALFVRILRKDLRCGISSSTINKAIPGLIPGFSCMLAHKYEPKRVTDFPVAVQPKHDGVRVLVYVDQPNGIVRFHSRNGKEDFASMPTIASALLIWGPKGGTYWLDGEITSGGFNKTVSEVRTKKAVLNDATLQVFEYLTPHELAEGSTIPHHERHERLAALEIFGDHVKLVGETLVHSHEEIVAQYEAYRAAGLEGAIVKPLNGLYRTKRSHDWLKMKAEESEDLRIASMFEGEGKYKGMLGGVIVTFNGVEVRVGSGFSDSQRSNYWANQNGIIGRLAEVEYHEVTPDGSLRHPRFVRFRDDKDQEAA